jgi:hypothetical protein
MFGGIRMSNEESFVAQEDAEVITLSEEDGAVEAIIADANEEIAADEEADDEEAEASDSEAADEEADDESDIEAIEEESDVEAVEDQPSETA